MSLKSYKIPIQILIYKVLSTTLPTQTLPHTIFILNSPKMIAVIFKMEYYLQFCLPKVDHLMCVFPQKSICYSYFHLLFWNHTVKSMIHVYAVLYIQRGDNSSSFCKYSWNLSYCYIYYFFLFRTHYVKIVTTPAIVWLTVVLTR